MQEMHIGIRPDYFLLVILKLFRLYRIYCRIRIVSFIRIQLGGFVLGIGIQIRYVYFARVGELTQDAVIAPVLAIRFRLQFDKHSCKPVLLRIERERACIAASSVIVCDEQEI